MNFRFDTCRNKDGGLISFQLETWDIGKLTVNSAFSSLLRRNGLESFDSIWAKTADAAVAKKFRTDRYTLRFALSDGEVSRTFFIKRHGRSSWKEYVKPLLRLTWPILGARNEWNAILDFHAVGIPTMIPVAVGEYGENSFLMTEGLENCTKLSELNASLKQTPVELATWRTKASCIVAGIARKMHGAGMNHQDFYLGHLMQSESDSDCVYVIDLGRVQKYKQLAQRWIIKDLAQLDFSAEATDFERLRFLRQYLGRAFNKSDRSLIRRIQAKRSLIARHSRKNRL